MQIYVYNITDATPQYKYVVGVGEMGALDGLNMFRLLNDRESCRGHEWKKISF